MGAPRGAVDSAQWDARSSTAAGDVMAALDRDPHTTVPLLLEKVESPATRERALRLILALALGCDPSP